MDTIIRTELVASSGSSKFRRWLFRFFIACVACCSLGFIIISKKSFLINAVITLNSQSTYTFFRETTHSEHFEWQEIFTDFYVFSIYYTVNKSPELHATIIASEIDENFWLTTVCHCLYHSSSNETTHRMPRSTLERLPEPHGKNMTTGRLICPFPKSVHNFSLVDLECRYNERNISGTVTLPVPHVPAPKLSFAHCGPPIFHGYDQPAFIVEFVEYYRMMGISKFFWYEVDPSNRTKAVLNYYQRQGIMEVTKWIIPVPSIQIHYYAQMAFIYDCLLKTSMIYDYTVFSDLDEFFATSKQPPTFASIVSDGVVDCSVIRSSFMNQKASYAEKFDAKSGKPVLRTATITNRGTMIFKSGDRSKYICRGKEVDLPQIHKVNTFKGRHILDVPLPETTILLHFRKLGEPNVNTTLESRALIHREQLEQEVGKVWSSIFSS